ncbi:hypothetical protein EIP86_005836 [Pleurotus ostreatoroseus]|nr:hypothetical protein EIP86_005836 [Pleurotus ostreatoroseus]
MSQPPEIAGYAAEALRTLSPSQVQFLRKLPKAELHAHLNGCIPVHVLQELANARFCKTDAGEAVSSVPEAVRAGIEKLQHGVVLNEIYEFFGLFPAIYALTSTPEALGQAAHAVLALFLETSNGETEPQAAYLELRTGPRATPQMTRMQYLEAVLDEVERYPPERAALIVSLDRRMEAGVAEEVVNCAVELRKTGRRVVGIDLCGDPLAGDMQEFGKYFRSAKEAGLGVTMHISETDKNTLAETKQLLSYAPDRLGHATFLDAATREAIYSSNTCVEICLSSNLLCKTVGSLEDHHIKHYLECKHPIAICTDDTLPFRNSLLGEYALLMAAPPLGLGLSETEIEEIARMSMASRFPLPSTTTSL